MYKVEGGGALRDSLSPRPDHGFTPGCQWVNQCDAKNEWMRPLRSVQTWTKDLGCEEKIHGHNLKRKNSHTRCGWVSVFGWEAQPFLAQEKSYLSQYAGPFVKMPPLFCFSILGKVFCLQVPAEKRGI